MTTETPASERLDRIVPVPQTVSVAAQAYLARPPVGGFALLSGQDGMWMHRAQADEALRVLDRLALLAFPVDVQEDRIDGVRVHHVRPQHAAPRDGRILINLHGGGFVLGSGFLSEAIPLVHKTGIPTIVVDYRLAPEHPYPAAVDDVLAVYRAVLSNIPASSIGVYGASAGGFLTGQLMARLRAAGIEQPGCIGVLTAGGDLDDLGDSSRIFSLAGLWGTPSRRTDDPLSEVRAYLGSASSTDPMISPARGDLAGFPPSFLAAGTRDALLSATALFHRALRRAGVEADLHIFEAMPHAFWYAFQLPEAQEFYEAFAAFLDRHLAR